MSDNWTLHRIAAVQINKCLDYITDILDFLGTCNNFGDVEIYESLPFHCRQDESFKCFCCLGGEGQEILHCQSKSQS